MKTKRKLDRHEKRSLMRRIERKLKRARRFT